VRINFENFTKNCKGIPISNFLLTPGEEVQTRYLKIPTSACVSNVSRYCVLKWWGLGGQQKVMCLVELLHQVVLHESKRSFVAFRCCDADIPVCWADRVKHLSRDVFKLAPLSSTFFPSKRLLLKNTFCLSVRTVFLCRTCNSAIPVNSYPSCNDVVSPCITVQKPV